MAPRAPPPSSSPTPAAPALKLLISSIRHHPKNTRVWIQGTLLDRSPHMLTLDDGSGLALINIRLYPTEDPAANVESLRPGAYLMVIARAVKFFARGRVGLIATTIRDLTVHAPWLECLWSLEVTDATLWKLEKEETEHSVGDANVTHMGPCKLHDVAL